MVKVVLVNFRYGHKRFNENLKVVDEMFGKYTPLSLCYISSIIDDSGHDSLIIDAHAENLDDNEVIKRINEYGADALGVSFHSAYNVHDALPVIRKIKKHTSVKVIAGGYNFNLYPQEHMVHEEIDLGLVGESRESLPQILDSWNNIKKIKKIPGICYREGKKTTLVPGKRQEFNKLPLPRREDLPHKRYFQFISKKKNFTIMLTQTGCPFRCDFCAIPLQTYRSRDLNNIIDEIKDCKRFGIKEIDFFDATFTANRKRTVELCERIISENLDIDWSCRTRIDCVDEDLLKLMRKSGCRRIYYGIESADQSILDKTNKAIKLDKVEEVLRMTKKAGMMPLGFFMIGNVGETKKTIESTIKYSVSLPLDYAQFSVTIPKPKTQLDSTMINKMKKDYWAGYIMGEEREMMLPAIGTKLGKKELLMSAKRAYLKFYLRPILMIKMIVRIRSFHELKRYFKGVVWMMGLKI